MWKKIEKSVTLCCAALLVITATVSGTLAYLESGGQKEKAVSVGMVRIDQKQYERASENAQILRLFTQEKPLYPAVGTAAANVEFSWSSIGSKGTGLLYGDALNGEIDKIVIVENTGSRDAYIRTWFAFEQGSYGGSVLENVIHINMNTAAWEMGSVQDSVEIDGNLYTVLYADHIGPLKPGETSQPSLMQIYMDSDAGNDTVAAVDGNQDGKYTVLVTSQAADIDDLDTLFPYHPTGEYTYQSHYVEDFQQLQEAVASGSPVKLGSDIAISQPVIVPEGVSVRVDGNDFVLHREEGFTGTIFQLEDKATLDMQNVTVDGGAEEGIIATGALIASDGDATIILNGDTVLKNNYGKNAIRFPQNEVGTLILNGASILNNTADDGGAVWGGYSITMNAGSLISGNYSGTHGGAFRMYRGKLTVNGGTISNNTAATNGGAIYAWAGCSYEFNGGEVCFNSAEEGGALYTGQSALVTINNTSFHHNKAEINGGAIRMVSNSVLTMNGGRLYENYAVKEGGAVYGWNSSAQFIGGEIVDNTCLNGAGGVHMNNTNYKVLGPIIVQNNFTTNTNTESNFN